MYQVGNREHEDWEQKTVPTNEEVLVEYSNLVDQCNTSSIAASETFEVLGQLCGLANTISDFKLPHREYKFARSLWFVSCVKQVVHEGCMMYHEQQHLIELYTKFQDIANYAVNLALTYKSQYTYRGVDYRLDYINANQLHVDFGEYIAVYQTSVQSVVAKLDVAIQLISEIINACSSGQATAVVDALVACMKNMKNSTKQWQLLLELYDKLKLPLLDCVDQVRTASVAVEAFLLLQFNLTSIESHFNIRYALLDLLGITNAEEQTRGVEEVKEMCKEFKQVVKAKAEVYKENARREFNDLLTRTAIPDDYTGIN